MPRLVSRRRLPVGGAVAMVLLLTTAAVVAPVHASAPPPITYRATPDLAMKRVGATTFGIHSYQGQPRIPAGSYRINCYPRWRDMNPAPGKYDWRNMDNFLARVESYGFRDIVFSLCGTPAWAGRKAAGSDESTPYFGAGAASPPSKMSYWRDFLVAFSKRYRGRITAYEVWNEATSRFQWQGTPRQMARMTQVAHRAIKRVDPDAMVVGANVQTGEQPAWFKRFFPPYLKALRARNWPVDALSIHTYAGYQGSQPPMTLSQVVRRRPASIARVRRAMQAAGMPARVRLWDTETNYLGSFDAATQQALLAHTYLDSWRFGIRRTYWYMWTATTRVSWLGVQMEAGTPPADAYTKLVSWTKGARYLGCANAPGHLVVCGFRRSGDAFQIVYSDRARGKSTYFLPGGVGQACALTSETCAPVSRAIQVGYEPVRLT